MVLALSLSSSQGSCPRPSSIFPSSRPGQGRGGDWGRRGSLASCLSLNLYPTTHTPTHPSLSTGFSTSVFLPFLPGPPFLCSPPAPLPQLNTFLPFFLFGHLSQAQPPSSPSHTPARGRRPQGPGSLARRPLYQNIVYWSWTPDPASQPWTHI